MLTPMLASIEFRIGRVQCETQCGSTRQVIRMMYELLRETPAFVLDRSVERIL